MNSQTNYLSPINQTDFLTTVPIPQLAIFEKGPKEISYIAINIDDYRSNSILNWGNKYLEYKQLRTDKESNPFERFKNRYPSLLEKLDRSWNRRGEREEEFDHSVVINFLDTISKLVELKDLVPQLDKVGNLIWYNIAISCRDFEMWDKVESEIGNVAHAFYKTFGEKITEIRRLIHTECIDTTE